MNLNSDPNKVCIAFLIYHPDPGFIDLLGTVLGKTSGIYVVSNGADERTLEALRDLAAHQDIDFIENDQNLGVAEGLNQALRKAIDDGMEWIFTFDQDSRPTAETLQTQIRVLADLGGSEKIGIVAPLIIDQSSRKRMRYLQRGAGLFYKRTACEGRDVLRDVMIVLSSGSLLNLAAVQAIGSFRDDFFIDYVDTEYCLRLNSSGFEIVVACDAVLPHRLGDRQVRKMGALKAYPTFHFPERWYYISRNRIPMLREYGLKFPPWLSFEIVSSVYIFFRMLLFEDQRVEKLKAIYYGTLDGLRTRMGEIDPMIVNKINPAS